MRTLKNLFKRRIKGDDSVRSPKTKWLSLHNEEHGYNDNAENDNYEGEQQHGYHNPDHDSRNYWAYNPEHEDSYYTHQDEPQIMEDSRMPRNRNMATGYGNENSQFVEDFNNAKNRTRNYTQNEQFSNQGHERRMNNEPNPYYTDQYYYNPANYDRGLDRLNETADNYNQYADNDNEENAGEYDYDYYESYPRYGQVSDKDDRFRRSDEYPYNNDASMIDFEERKFETTDVRRPRRPNIRDKRY